MIISQSIYRQKLNHHLQKVTLPRGLVLDLGAQQNNYYHKYFPKNKILALDISGKPSVLASAQFLPFKKNSFKNVLALNVFEHLDDPDKVLDQLKYSLKSQGTLVIATPFFKNIHAHPNDYYRFTYQAWQHLLKKHGYTNIVISRLGDGPMEAIYDMLMQFIPLILRPIIWISCIPLDHLLTLYSPRLKEMYPLGYLILAQKK